jgi:hypothetical protein
MVVTKKIKGTSNAEPAGFDPSQPPNTRQLNRNKQEVRSSQKSKAHAQTLRCLSKTLSGCHQER